MTHSRRDVIVDMLEARKSDADILHLLDKEFPPEQCDSSNIQALAGTKWDVGRTSTPEKEPTQHSQRKGHRKKQVPILQRSELVKALQDFNPEPIIQRYKQEELHGKSADQLVAFTMSMPLCSLFWYEKPLKRYRKWRWYKKGPLLLLNLNKMNSQDAFDLMAINLGETLVADWGAKNERGEPSRMNKGMAMKIVNLLLKHLACSEHCHNSAVLPLLHVPWDSFTLLPLRSIWTGDPPIPESHSQEFVKTLDMYKQLHKLITDITEEAGVDRKVYEFWAWDATH